MATEVRKTPQARVDLEPTASDTVRIFRQELRFARAMARGTPGTFALIGAMGGVFLLVVILAEVLSGRFAPEVVHADYLILLGAKNNEAIRSGQWWRFGSMTFLHGGAFHLLVNAYALYVLGNVLEKLYGTRRFFVLFALSGLAGAMGSFLFTPANSVGASGAIFGLLGGAVVFGLRFKDVLPARVRRVLTVGLLPWVALNVVLGLVIPQIDNAAHMGGLVGGGLVAVVLGTRLSSQRELLGTALQWLILAAAVCYMVYAIVAAAIDGTACAQTVESFNLCLQSLQT